MTDTSKDLLLNLDAHELRDFLRRAFEILNAMAEAGIGMEGREDPADVVCDFMARIGTEDPHQAIRLLEVCGED